MSKKKKIIILSCMILLLAVTAVFNYVLTVNPDSPETVNAANYFSQFRSERVTSRNEQLLQLDAVISASEEESQTKADALAMKLKLTNAMEKELLLENLIKAVGYADAVVTIGVDSQNINVIVKDAEFNQDDAVAVYTILQEEAAATPDLVKIIPIS